jgi:hypothetical protein
VGKIAVILTPLAAVALLTGLAAAGTSQSVKTGTANELVPAATANWFAWTQSSRDHPNRTDVRAEATPIDGTDDFRVNPQGTHAWTGGIEGDQLVYQQVANGNSNIKRFNLATQTHLGNPDINTARWEWHPSISTESSDDGDTWILFGRQNVSTFAQKVIAYNVTDSTSVLLEETKNGRYSLIPGQVNGDWVTWTACKPKCNVRYRNIVTLANRQTVPHPDFVAHQYGSSISDDGVLYYARSGRGCGANVRIMRFDSGNNDLMVGLPDNRDLFFTYTSDEAANHVYYDRVGCGSGAWNIYKFVD